MIPGWCKGVLLGALLLFAAVDLGSPLAVRVQLDGTVADATAAAGRTWLRGHDAKAAEAAARDAAAADGADLERFEILADGRVAVGVVKRAQAKVFNRVEQLSSWYDVRVEATSSGSTL